MNIQSNDFLFIQIFNYISANINELIKLFFYFLSETEGELTRKQKVTLPWGPLYCVLQQDEQSFTAYCSEEISVSVQKYKTFLQQLVPLWRTKSYANKFVIKISHNIVRLTFRST